MQICHIRFDLQPKDPMLIKMKSWIHVPVQSGDVLTIGVQADSICVTDHEIQTYMCEPAMQSDAVELCTIAV